MGVNWASKVKQQHTAAMSSFARALPQYSIPIADSRHTMPGWAYLGTIYYCYPDVQYPWDPAVLRAIREFEPTAVPLTTKTIWRKADYGHELQNKDLVIVRHGIGRVVREPLIPTHQFACSMPVHHQPALRSNAHVLAAAQPNWIEVHYYDRGNRQISLDLPGAYLPFDWEMYNALRIAHEDGRTAREISTELLDDHRADHDRTEAYRESETAYIGADVDRAFEKAASDISDVEWKEIMTAAPDSVSQSQIKPALVNPGVPA